MGLERGVEDSFSSDPVVRARLENQTRVVIKKYISDFNESQLIAARIIALRDPGNVVYLFRGLSEDEVPKELYIRILTAEIGKRSNSIFH